ncbi:hypothetical protein D3C84_632670 [compost metagenome]
MNPCEVVTHDWFAVYVPIDVGVIAPHDEDLKQLLHLQQTSPKVGDDHVTSKRWISFKNQLRRIVSLLDRQLVRLAFGTDLLDWRILVQMAEVKRVTAANIRRVFHDGFVVQTVGAVIVVSPQLFTVKAQFTVRLIHVFSDRTLYFMDTFIGQRTIADVVALEDT